MSAAQKPGRRTLQRATKAVMKSVHFDLPRYETPIRLRPWFVVFTCLIMVMLAFLGFTNFSHSLPLNDKLLHFFCFCVATGFFYFIFDVEEEARRIWFWRHSGVIFTVAVCVVCGGIISEFVQSMLPSKEFQFGDIVANLLGSGLGLAVSYRLEKYYRHRREIKRLYRPLDGSASDLEEGSDDEETGTSLLPLHNGHTVGAPKLQHGHKPSRLGDVWDEREEIFGIGDSDEEDATPRNSSAPRTESEEPIPTITVTGT